MSTKEPQNIWFGVAMFLGGLLAGIILTSITGLGPTAQRPAGGVAAGAPTAPDAPQAPQVNIQELIAATAKNSGVDAAAFKTCIDADKFKQMIADEEASGQKAGVNGTPGNILLDMKTGKARVLSGAQPLAAFQKAIDDMLKNPTSKNTDPNTPDATNVKPVNLEKEHIKGSKTARLALIEYVDYQCPFCHRVHPTLEQVVKQYDGKVMWVVRHFPLSFHPNALPLANGAECANEIGGNDAFWSFTDAIMASDQVN